LDPLIKSQLLYQLSYAPLRAVTRSCVHYQRDTVLSSLTSEGLPRDWSPQRGLSGVKSRTSVPRVKIWWAAISVATTLQPV
jgi:hypothetical protein